MGRSIACELLVLVLVVITEQVIADELLHTTIISGDSQYNTVIGRRSVGW